MTNTKPSPIEDMLAPHLAAICKENRWELHRQVRFGVCLYVPDFTISASRNVHVIVECDGHEWHDRTKEQAAHDRARDRFFLRAAGAPTIRFTGAEIWRDAELCAAEVEEIVRCLIALNQEPRRG